ncbi:unnamed protein product [Rotaria sp. Silwood1]|nr:unnamed protein product [Rotaria sp. Silwood1]CAF4568610.1 unnamed protein product [Rotaria sp. Silwood1]
MERSEIRNQHVYDEQEQTLQRQNIELHDRIKRFERQLEVLKQDQPKDHDKELIKRALAKQASKDAIEYQKLLKQKNQEIEQLNIQLEQLPKFNIFELALRQANIEKLYLERRLLVSTTSSSPSSSSSTSSLLLKLRTNAPVSHQVSYLKK